MNAHLRTGQDKPGERHAPAARRADTADTSSTAPAMVARLQRIAGNRAVAEMLQPPLPTQRVPARRAPVQREPVGGWRPKDSPDQLHLDPQIEAQIRAINAMNAISAPERVMAGLLELNLPPMSATIGPPTPPTPEAAPASPTAATTPQGPAPGTGLMGPRAGTPGDVWKVVLAEPSLGASITGLGDQAAARAKSKYDTLSTGATVAV